MKNREIIEISRKGQLLIPKFYREKTGIKPGSKVALSADGHRLIVNPLPRDPIAVSRGFLKKSNVSLADQLLKERRAETKKEKRIRR